MGILFASIFQIMLEAASDGIRSRRSDWYWHAVKSTHALFWLVLAYSALSGIIPVQEYPLGVIACYIGLRFALFQHVYNNFAEKPFGYLSEKSSWFDKALLWIGKKTHPSIVTTFQAIIGLGAILTLIYNYS